MFINLSIIYIVSISLIVTSPVTGHIGVDTISSVTTIRNILQNLDETYSVTSTTTSPISTTNKNNPCSEINDGNIKELPGCSLKCKPYEKLENGFHMEFICSELVIKNANEAYRVERKREIIENEIQHS